MKTNIEDIYDYTADIVEALGDILDTLEDNPDIIADYPSLYEQLDKSQDFAIQLNEMIETILKTTDWTDEED